VAERRGLELAVDIDPQLPPSLVGDPHRLRQVLINLVGNAVKFTLEAAWCCALGCSPRGKFPSHPG